MRCEMFVNSIVSGDKVIGESAMFAACDRVRLLYKADRVLKVYNQVSGKAWQEGLDWSFDKDTNSIVFLPQSSMPYITSETIAPDDEHALYYPAPGANAVPGRVGGGNVLFDAKSFFAENQIEIDYIADCTQTLLPELDAMQGKKLPRFRSKLAQGQTVRIKALGDSITEGYNCGKFIGFAPYRKPWFELFVDFIMQKYQVKCDWENRGINGATSEKPLLQPELLEGTADLWVIAYGMNDLAKRNAEEFACNLKNIMAKLSENDPEAEFLLVTPMSGNPEWSYTPLEKTAAFSEAIRQLPGDDMHILCADVNKLWSKVLEKKSFYDITGNGVNHPNDYSHTIYAAALNALF